MSRVIAGLLCLLITREAASAPELPADLTPPAALDGLRAGTPVDDAKLALAAFAPDPAYTDAAKRTRLVRDAGGGARYYVLVSEGTIARIGIEAPKAGLVEALTRRWGKPARATNLANEALVSWRAASWRVDVACRGELCRLAFHQPLAPAFFGAAVAPPGALAALQPWARRAEVERALPRFARGAELPAGPEDVRLAVELDRQGRLRSVLVAGLPDDGRAIVERAWGAPGDGDTWWNGAAGWRARLDDGLRTLQLFPYVPAAKLLGTGAGIAALPRPILGATRDQIARAYGAGFTLPPIEDGLGATAVHITYDAGGRATALAIELPFATAARRDELLRLLEAKWGAATRTQAGYTFAASTQGLTIEAREHAASLQLRLRL